MKKEHWWTAHTRTTIARHRGPQWLGLVSDSVVTLRSTGVSRGADKSPTQAMHNNPADVHPLPAPPGWPRHGGKPGNADFSL